MRITYLHQYFNTPEMPGGTRSYEMARRLAAKGHQVSMITSWREDDGRREWFKSDEAGVRVHWLPVPYSNRMRYRERMRAFLRFAYGAAGKAASLPADVVFATSTPLTISLPGAYAAMRQKAPMVFEVRDLWPELPIAVGALQNPLLKMAAKWLERLAYSRSERIVALSPGMKEGIMKRGVSADKIAVIPNSADLECFDPRHADPQAFRKKHPEIGNSPLLVYAGSMGVINGLEYLPRIAASCRKQRLGIRFAVVGQRGQEEQKIRDTAKKLDVLNKNFHIYPPVPKRRMPEVLAAADLAISLFIDLEPMWANSANKFFDALASGTPVAINYGGWQAELLEETGAGIVLPPNAPDSAAHRLGAFLSDNKRLEEAGRAARRLAEQRFSRDHLTDRLEEVLLTAVRQTSGLHVE